MSTEKKDSSVRVHIRVLYLLIAVLCFGFAYATWICLTEIRQLRSDLDGEMAALSLRRGDVVEFSGDGAWSDGGTATSEADSTPGGVTIERMGASSDEVVRVRRDTKRRRSRPSFFTDGSEPTEGSGGSGGDWVWLTSYSRIPVSDSLRTSAKGLTLTVFHCSHPVLPLLFSGGLGVAFLHELAIRANSCSRGRERCVVRTTQRTGSCSLSINVSVHVFIYYFLAAVVYQVFS